MPIKYTYDQKKKIIHTHPCGLISSAEIISCYKQIIDDRNIKDKSINIIHLEKVESWLPAFEDMIAIDDLCAETREKKIKHTIYIGKKDIHFGIARMLGSVHEINDLKETTFVVRSRGEAEDIIKQKKIEI